MAHFAKINKKNIVEQVIVADSKEWCESRLGGEWIQTSYNTYAGKHTQNGTPLRKNFASIGYIYDRKMDAFYSPKPYPSWKLNKNTCLWEPPTPRPELTEEIKDHHRRWNEETLSWITLPREDNK